jgi:hypothetical protein
MKHIKTFEKLGVPNNITETGEIIYNNIINKLKKRAKNNNSILDKEQDIEFDILDNFKISDYSFSKIETIITFKYAELKTLQIYAYGFNFPVESINPRQLKFAGNTNTINLNIDVAIPEDNLQPNPYQKHKNNTYITDLIKYLKSNSDNIISSITHELAHAYNKYKKPTETITDRNDYQTVKEIRMNIDPIDKFLHILYYISDIENIVRPSEVAADIIRKNITKDQFYNYLKTNEVYQKLIKAKYFSYEQLKKDLLENIKDVNIFIFNHLEIFQNNIPKNNTEKIKLILQTFYSSIINLKIKNIIASLGLDHPFAPMFLPDFEERVIIHNKYARKITKQKDYDKFFDFEEKRINFAADKMIRKISKLYDMAKDTDEPKKSSKEIKDWKLYHKVNKTNTKFTTETYKSTIDQNMTPCDLCPVNDDSHACNSCKYNNRK